jgi:exopolyphosphatase / guanosine-5'-triphosphate,3'-diphosphate pyrophosphatase
MTSTSSETDPLAAIDLGSNSFRLEVGELSGGRYRRIDYLKETVRLGGGLDANGMLTAEAMVPGIACLRRFASRLGDLSCKHIRAVATQTLREARNRDAFLVRANDALGHPIEVISGREEARLIYTGVALLQPARSPRLVVDIGGRSTELVLGNGVAPGAAESFGVGAVGLSMRWFAGGHLDADAFRAAQADAAGRFEEAMRTFSRPTWDEALGSSGTVGAVSRVLQATGRSDGRIRREDLDWCIARCVEAGHVDRIDLPTLKNDRRAVIPGGLAILRALFETLDIGELLPAKGALRHGLIVDLAERLQGRPDGPGADRRAPTVRELQQRFRVDCAQADRVEVMALSYFDAAKRPLPAEQRRELVWACALHEAGLMVSHHDYHRHGAYLLAHADAPGFSQSQQRRIGNLVLGQRGGLGKLGDALAEPAFAWQLLCLRLAVISCHARDSAPQGMRLHVQGTDATLEVAPRSTERFLPTTLLLAEEAQAWQKTTAMRLTIAVQATE